MRTLKTLDYLSHKLMHAFIGAMGQAVKGPQAMLAGAAGGALGEILGEMFLNNKEMLEKMADLKHQGKSDADILKACVDAKAFLVKFTAALGMGLCGLDMQAAYDGADCAIENNCLGLIMAALAVGYVYVTGEELVNAYKHGGFDEVLRVIRAEAEVVFITEATATELGGMPGAALAAGGYMVYRIGGKLYPTAQKAWGALIKAQPALDNLNIKKGFANWCEKQGIHQHVVRDLKNGRIKGVHGAQQHHIISDKIKKTRDHPLWKLADMDPDDAVNRILLPTKDGAEKIWKANKRSLHQGRHQKIVNEDLAAKMDKVVKKFQYSSVSQEHYAMELKRIIQEERRALICGERMLNKHHRPQAIALPGQQVKK